MCGRCLRPSPGSRAQPGGTGYLKGSGLEAEVLLLERLVLQPRLVPGGVDSGRALLTPTGVLVVCKAHCTSVTALDLLSSL